MYFFLYSGSYKVGNQKAQPAPDIVLKGLRYVLQRYFVST